MFRTAVETLLQNALAEREDLFLIDFNITDGNAIGIVIDGDKGVLVEDCMFISRAIEHNLDRDEHDFSLQVASAGADALLTHQRQYVKNVGRTLEVKTEDTTFKGKLTQASDSDIVLEWKTREPKPVGKGKVTVQKQETLPYNVIKQAKVIITF